MNKLFNIDNIKLFIVICLSAITTIIQMPLSNVSAQEGCFDYLSKNNNLIRVGISNNNFSKLEYNSIDIGATGIYKVIDKTSGKLLTELEPSQIINITISNSKFTVKANDTVLVDMVAGPLIIKTDANSKLKVAGLYRGGKPALYRGIFEIARTPNSTGRFSLINVLPLEEYLRGVVPNEIPVYFGIEAVKAQAIAARNYAVRPRTRTYNNFDVCDSVASQVYFGANTETTISDRAIEETEGLYSLYDGEIILALYSSTAGGYTESYENAFTQPGSTVFPSTPKPYLKGKPDIPGTPPLYDEAAAEAFYTSKPQSFDINSSYYRWTKKWTREELENTLKQTLPTVSNTGMLLPSFRTGQNLGTLKELRVVSRGVSGKAMLVEIITDQGSWVIKKELIIRQVLKHQGKMLPSANIIIKNKYDELGNLVEVVVHGGGFGHGVGMSQFGAGYMSKHNYTFDQILQHYYDNTAIGTKPVILSSKINKNPVTQKFYSPNGKGELVIEAPEILSSIKISINSNELNLDKSQIDRRTNRINVDNYINKGKNEVTYYPPSENGRVYKAWIEVYKAKNE